jgi:hypothetical protein
MATPSRTPVLVLSLIFTMLCLSIGSIALIIYFNANRPDSTAIASACKSEVGAAIKKESDRVAAACEEKEAVVVTKTVVGNANHPGFKYPENLQVTGEIKRETSGNRFSIGMYPNAPIFECSECDGGPTAAIRINKTPTALLLNASEALAPYILTVYPVTGTFYRNVVSKQETINGQIVTVVTAEYDDDFFSEKNVKVEHIFTQKGASTVEVKYVQYQNTKFIDYIAPSVWQTVRSSLDFSKIE